MWILTEEQYFLKPRDMNEVVEDGDLVDRSEAKMRKQFNRLAVVSTLKFPLAIYRFMRKNKNTTMSLEGQITLHLLIAWAPFSSPFTVASPFFGGFCWAAAAGAVAAVVAAAAAAAAAAALACC